MVEFSMKREVGRSGVRYSLEGVFTGAAAYELMRALCTEVDRVELDFSRVKQCFDVGLAALATELASPRGKKLAVELRGLGLHHRRLLHYFGLDLPPSLAAHDDLSADPLPPVHALAPA